MTAEGKQLFVYNLWKDVFSDLRRNETFMNDLSISETNRNNLQIWQILPNSFLCICNFHNSIF